MKKLKSRSHSESTRINFSFNYKSDGTGPLRINPHSNPIDMSMFYKKVIHCFEFSNEFNTNDFQRT